MNLTGNELKHRLEAYATNKKESVIDNQLIDLTQTITPEMPGVSWESARTLEDDGWNAGTLHLYSHSGTHMDAPLHFGCGDQATIDQTPLNVCLSTAWMAEIDAEPSCLIEVNDLGNVANQIQPGQSLLLKTGWSQFACDAEKFRNQLPRISVELAQWCVERQIKILGVEPPSVADVNNLDEVTQIHEILLGGGVTIVEGLTNLDQLPTTAPFLFGALPLKVLGGDGSPCRAFASLKDLKIA
ncbi:cyclase family protein [Mariniblastus fucicola]|nr:cyclase family protein [Mariniblastus fucicola]